MKARVCICCGEAFQAKTEGPAGTRNLCAACSDIFDETGDVSPGIGQPRSAEERKARAPDSAPAN